MNRNEKLSQLNRELHQVLEAPDLDYFERTTFLTDIQKSIDSLKEDLHESP